MFILVSDNVVILLVNNIMLFSFKINIRELDMYYFIIFIL